MSKTAPKDENIYPPLDLGNHQAPDGGHSLLLFFKRKVLLFFSAQCKFLQRGLVIPKKDLSSGSHVGQGLWEVPSFEYLFINEVSVVCTNDGF